MLETEHFRITESEIQLLRSRFPYKKVPFEQLTKAELTTGSKIKYPIRTLLFGVFLIAISTSVILGMGEFKFPVLGGENDPRGAIVPWIVYGIISSIGIYSIWISIAKTTILRVYFNDRTFEVLSLQELRKTGERTTLIQFLKTKLPNNILSVDKNWL